MSSYALRGRVVTMNAARTVLQDGIIYVSGNTIVDVRPTTAARPRHFASVTPQHTHGTIYPGMIELHNHLPYGVLQLWKVPKKYGNRDQWSGPSTPDYHRLVSGPMGVLGRDPDVIPAIVRYVEVRCLLGGTTTSQGVALASNAGIIKHFKGIVRNVESTGDPALPPAATHIADVIAADAERFHQRLSGSQKLILHLSEGTDASAHKHFLALHYAPDKWAITPNLIGIHCVAFTPEDFATFAGLGGSMVWSPLSNLLLYGATADIASAIAAGVPVALGSDWAPSGSKNLLGELKVARLAAAGTAISSRDLLAMVTVNPAKMLGWDATLGSLDKGKRADLVVVGATGGDPYDTLVDATEADLELVVIDGVARCGSALRMKAAGSAGGERLEVAGRTHIVNFTDASADPLVAGVSVAESIRRLSIALHDLGEPQATGRQLTAATAPAEGQVWLALEDVLDTGQSVRPHLPYRGRVTEPDFPARNLLAAGPPLPLPSLPLDPLTAVDNPGFYELLGTERNLPPAIAASLLALAPH
ncbi:MAG: 5-methylthioadenosine/S-adenosylhomocysteine deaminase [Pseudonocardiales bacterium]|jgi:hypothetical protein|nr:5-methylthioadenosine/S-adenosylhomocysteine deaminase [Pseudonocardiales bacterium]